MITDHQIAALKYLIAISKDGNDTVKRIMFFLVDQSECLTKEIYLTLTQGYEGFSADEIDHDARQMSGMLSVNRTTHLGQVLDAMGTEFCFSTHFGHLTDGKFDAAGIFPGLPKEVGGNKEVSRVGVPIRYTYWLAKDHYSRTAAPVKATREELEAIDLTKPGLYPEVENQRRAG